MIDVTGVAHAGTVVALWRDAIAMALPTPLG